MAIKTLAMPASAPIADQFSPLGEDVATLLYLDYHSV
jgi:hypothetical protein